MCISKLRHRTWAKGGSSQNCCCSPFPYPVHKEERGRQGEMRRWKMRKWKLGKVNQLSKVSANCGQPWVWNSSFQDIRTRCKTSPPHLSTFPCTWRLKCKCKTWPKNLGSASWPLGWPYIQGGRNMLPRGKVHQWLVEDWKRLIYYHLHTPPPSPPTPKPSGGGIWTCLSFQGTVKARAKSTVSLISSSLYSLCKTSGIGSIGYFRFIPASAHVLSKCPGWVRLRNFLHF